MSKDLDFSRMRYAIGKESVLDAHPELKKYKEFASADDKVLRYVIYCYDKYSPFHRVAAGDINKRKRLAMEKAGMLLSKINNDEQIQEIINGENMLVNIMIVRYIRLQSDAKFAILMAKQENYYHGLFVLTSRKVTIGDAIDEALSKNKFSDSLMKQAEDLEKLSTEVFYDEPYLMVAADDMMEQEDEFKGVCERYALPARPNK